MSTFTVYFQPYTQEFTGKSRGLENSQKTLKWISAFQESLEPRFLPSPAKGQHCGKPGYCIPNIKTGSSLRLVSLFSKGLRQHVNIMLQILPDFEKLTS